MASVTVEKSKVITINNRIKVDGVIVRYQEARIDSENPNNLSINSYYGSEPNVMELYKDNRSEVRAKENEFEDYVFTEQEKLKLESNEEVA